MLLPGIQFPIALSKARIIIYYILDVTTIAVISLVALLAIIVGVLYYYFGRRCNNVEYGGSGVGFSRTPCSSNQTAQLLEDDLYQPTENVYFKPAAPPTLTQQDVVNPVERTTL